MLLHPQHQQEEQEEQQPGLEQEGEQFEQQQDKQQQQQWKQWKQSKGEHHLPRGSAAFCQSPSSLPGEKRSLSEFNGRGGDWRQVLKATGPPACQ